MFMICGAAALFLASVGLYGVLAVSVNQRQHELGLRVALGGSPGRVVRLVFGQTRLQLTIGMVLGLGLSLLLGRGLSFILFGVEAVDDGVMVGVAALLSLTAVASCLVPARRATRVDPMVAMQGE